MKYMLRTAILMGLMASPALAQSPVTVSGAWARATAPGQTTGAVYMSLTSPRDDALTGIASPQADMAMLHKTVHEGHMTDMEDMDALQLPAGKKVTLAPHGMHVMLMGLKSPLKAGETVSLDLNFLNSGTEHITVPVEPLGASGPPG